MAARSGHALISLFFLSGAILLIFLILLGGAVNKTPLDQFYFLEASTQGIAGAPPVTRWTFWGACSVLNRRNNCPQVHVAYPLDPRRNFAGSDAAIPEGFIKHARRYYLMTKFMFTFVILGLTFALAALVSGILALCSPIGSSLSGTMCFVALLFQSVAAALMSGAYVRGREHFRTDGRVANIGKANFAMMWTAVVCLFLPAFMFCTAGARGRRAPPRKVDMDGHMYQRDEPPEEEYA